MNDDTLIQGLKIETQGLKEMVKILQKGKRS